MTKTEFNNLKIGDRCYLRERNGTYTSTEVLKIDKIFNKVVVLLHSAPVSYRYILKKLTGNQRESGNIVGSFKMPSSFNLKTANWKY